MKRKEGKDKIFVKGKLIILEDNTEIKNFFIHISRKNS